MKTRNPRRKVVSSRFSSRYGCKEYWDCTLTCGHVVTAYGMAPRGQPFARKVGPKTCECVKCGNDAESKGANA